MSAVAQLGSEMTGRSIKSAAGELVDILSDEDWAELTGTNVASVRKPYKSKLAITRALWHHGAFKSPNGRATMILHSMAEQYGYQGKLTAIPGNMSDPLNAPAFERQTKGKRTYSIRLAALPETWLRRMFELDVDEDEPEPEPVPVEPEPIPEPSQGDRDAAVLMERVIFPQGGMIAPVATQEPDGPELVIDLPEYVPPPEVELEPSPYLEVSSQVAMALLTQVVEIISAGSPEQTDARVRHLTQEVAEVADKLSRRLHENDGLRRKVRELGEEINAVKYERDGLRTRLRQTEHNLKVALKSDVMQQVNERVRQELDKVMRVAPSTTPRKGDPV